MAVGRLRITTKMSSGDDDPDRNDSSAASQRSKPSSREENRPLPAWALNSLKPVLHLFSRILWRIKYQGLERVPTGERGFIIIANHQTYFDPFWLGAPIRRDQRYLAWDEAFDWPVVGWGLRLLGAWPLKIERGNPTAMRRSVQWLREGGVLVIFPEGGRCFSDGEMMRFKNGACRIAIEAGVPIVPATILGGERIWPRGKRYPRLGRVEVVFHDPHEMACEPDEETRTCARRMTEHLFEVVASARSGDRG